MSFDSQSDIVPSTCSSLIRRVRSGEQEAWERFVRVYAPLVYSRCRSRGLDQHDAADVVQTVFFKVNLYLPQFTPQKARASFRSWLRRIAGNAVIDHFREQQKHQEILDEATVTERTRQLEALFDDDFWTSSSDVNAPSASTSRTLFVRAAAEEVRGEFEEQTWTAFWRFAIDGNPAAEVAEELGMTAAAVRQAKYAVLKRLRTEMEGLLDL